MGCTDYLACTYSEIATEEDNSCLYFDSCGECGGNDNCAVFIEADLTIFVDSTLVSDSEALEVFENNFEDFMETQLGLPESCVEVIQIIFLSRVDLQIEIIYTITLTAEEIQETDFNPNLTPEEIISEINEDISVFEDEDIFEDIEFIEGCTNSEACNFNTEANIEAECFVPEGCDVCSGETNDGSGFILTNDSDGDGVCDIDEIIGCTDYLACNYDATLTTDTDNSLCNYSTDLDECATCSGETDGTGTILSNDIDDDGICDFDEVYGCLDELACNYDSLATESDSCIYLEVSITESVVFFDGEYTPILFANHSAIEPETTWYLGDQEIPLENSDSLYAYENGFYQVDIYDQEQDCFGVDTMCIRNVSLSDEIINMYNIYPNPASEYVIVEFDKFLNEFIIELIDISGEILFFKSEKENFKDNIKISLKGIATQTCFLRFKNNNFQYIYPLIIDNH